MRATVNPLSWLRSSWKNRVPKYGFLWNSLQGIFSKICRDNEDSIKIVDACRYTGLFISPSGISELDCATTKTDMAERNISIGRESLLFFFVLGALAYFQVPRLGGSREEKWRSQWIRKRSVSWNLPKLSQLWLCNGGFGSCTTQNHLHTKQFVNGTWIPAEWLPVCCETNRPSGLIGPDGLFKCIKCQCNFWLLLQLYWYALKCCLIGIPSYSPCPSTVHSYVLLVELRAHVSDYYVVHRLL